MYQFPIRIPQGQNLIVAQPFKSIKPVDISKALSIETTEHNGVDICVGNTGDSWDTIAKKTWGAACVWPFPFPGIVWDSRVSSPFGATKYARCQVDGIDPATGIQYSIIYLHLSSVTNTKAPEENKEIVYKQGDVIGHIGNNGFVRPPPTPEKPLDGSHLHCGLGVKKPGEINFIMADPLLHLDVSNPFREVFVQPEPPVTQKLYTFARTLKKGDRGGDVVVLQYILKLENCFDYPTFTGYYGDITVAGVKRLQEKYVNEILRPLGLVVGTGNFGNATMSWINRKYGLV